MSINPDTCTSDEVVEHLLVSVESILRSDLRLLDYADTIEKLFPDQINFAVVVDRAKQKELILHQLDLFEHRKVGDCDRENLIKGLEKIRDVFNLRRKNHG